MFTIYEITQEAFKTLQDRKIAAKQEGFDLSLFINSRKPARVENGIGFVSIYGPLMRDSAPIDKLLGTTDYGDIENDCESVLAAGARCIVFEVDSGGGYANGCVECAEYIAALPVPTVALISGQSCSAAYKLTSSCNWIVSTKSSDVGNIGVILVMVDTSKLMENAGVSFICFTNDGATLKSTGHLDSLTEEQTEFLQESINEMGAVFKNHVLANRPNVSEEVFKAGWYSGSKALELGLVDEIGTASLALQRALELAELAQDLTEN